MDYKLDILVACDTHPDRAWARDRLPAIRKVLEAYEADIIDIFEFESVEGAHYFHETGAPESFFCEDLIRLNEKIYDKIMLLKPRVLMLGTVDNYREYILSDTLDKFRLSGILVVGILGDDEFNYEQNKNYVPLFDFSVAYVKRCVDEYTRFSGRRCLHLPNSCHLENEPRDISSAVFKHDVALVGAPFGNRPKIIRSLIDAGAEVAVYGSKQWEKYSWMRGCYKGFISSDEFDTRLKESKIILALLEDHITGALHMNTKIWEAVRVGRLPIVTYYEPLITDYGLVEGESIIFYHSEDEIPGLVRKYSRDHEGREAIVRNLIQEVIKRLDYKILYGRQFEYLLNVAKKRAGDVTQGAHCLSAEQVAEYSYLGGRRFSVSSGTEKILALYNGSDKLVIVNRLEKGLPIKLFYPLFSLSSIFYPSKEISGSLLFLHVMLKILRKEYVIVRQYLVSSQEMTFSGRLIRSLRAHFSRY